MTCPLCTADAPLSPYDITGGPVASLPICATCATQLDGEMEPNHWRALASTMWAEDAPTQVLAYRALGKLEGEDWARDLKEMLYLEDDTLEWAQNVEAPSNHRDSNGVPLASGDTVVLIKDLPVKGAGFTAKRGTAVHRISLVPENDAHIEGRVEGQRIVILTEFVKKR